MIKLVTIDLDGTLFDAKKNISKLNRDAISKARKLGVKIVIATGRPFSGVWPLLEDLGLTSNEDYVILYNGAKLMNCGTKEIIYSSYLSGRDVKEVYNDAKRLKIDFHAFRKNGELITPRFNPYTNVEATINHIDPKINDIISISDDEEFIKAMMVGDPNNIEHAMAFVNPKLVCEYNMLRSSQIFLEFLPKQANKGLALKALAKYLNIDMKDTMAIGDAGNDIPMIEASEIGVAMKNAFPEVKEKAKFITKSNEESGVAYAINKFIIEA